MYACMHACRYACMCVCIHVCMCVFMYASMYVCTHACMYMSQYTQAEMSEKRSFLSDTLQNHISSFFHPCQNSASLLVAAGWLGPPTAG